jgi:hypothetical protein
MLPPVAASLIVLAFSLGACSDPNAPRQALSVVCTP